MLRPPGRLAPLLLLAALSAACGPSGEPADGRAYFRQLNCRSCHRIAGEGAGRGGFDLTFVGFRKSEPWLDLFLKDPQAYKKDSLMPNPRLSEAARAKLVSYLAGLRGEGYKDRKPWDEFDDPVEKGRAIYNVAGCVSCHGRGGSGGYPNNNVPGGLVPPVDRVFEGFTRDELIARVAKGKVSQPEDPSKPRPMLEMPAWEKVLSAAEIEAVVDYLLTLRPKGGASADF